MASNAAVEKLKAFGLRHGEKVAVGLSATLFLWFATSAVLRKTIDITPEQVREHTNQSKTNLERTQGQDSILKKLEESFLKAPDFEKQVDKAASTTLDASTYKPANPWVFNEPGAGLLRDKPELIKVTELYAYPGRGGALVYEIKDGERVPDDGKKIDEFTQKRRLRKRRPQMGGMMAGGMGGMMGRRRRTPRKTAAQRKREYDEAVAAEKKKQDRALAGGKDAGAKGKVSEEDAPPEDGNFKEITRGLRWVVLTGTLDYKKLRDNYLTALKIPEVAYPHFVAEGGLKLQRQALDDAGEWSEWEDVDRDANLEILDNLPEVEEELTPDEVRVASLVDPLPFLKAGYWERVHVASLVEQKDATKGNMNPRGGMMGGGAMMAPMMGGAGARDGEEGGPMMMGGGMMGGVGGGGAKDDMNFPRTDADVVMVRVLDFTVEPDTTYRYRVQLAVYNPNKGREDVNPGVDTKTEVLKGEWSDPTEPVTMPADVTAYAMRRLPSSVKRSDLMEYQVIRWLEDDGATVVRTFNAAPGDLIGESATAVIPMEGQKKTKMVDFTSDQLVLDATGGPRPLPSLAGKGGEFDVPALSMIVRSDGSMLLRFQAKDTNDEIRKDIDSNFKKELADVGKRRSSSYGAGGGMFGGMMGAGMGGMGMMGPGGAGGMQTGTMGGGGFGSSNGQARSGAAVVPGQGAGTGR
jgi:hypothetical protein